MRFLSLKPSVLLSCILLSTTINQTISLLTLTPKSGNIKPSVVTLSAEEEANILKQVKVPEGFELTLVCPLAISLIIQSMWPHPRGVISMYPG